MSIATINNKTQLQEQIDAWKSVSLKVGFVPTMGALHEGHLSLVRLAKESADKVVVSIYVNPTQFAPHEDFESYPRDFKGDAVKLAETGVDLIYFPSTEELYPGGAQSDVKAGSAAEGLETDFRPHFFDGVCSIVSRLFDHVTPDLAVFGEKDFQQLMVIREMVQSQNRDIEIIGAPIIRDGHGFALSSRNAYLSEKELATARQLNAILKRHCEELQAMKQSSKNEPEALDCFASARNDEVGKALLSAGFDKVDYIEERWNRILAAVWLGKTRLIDNMPRS